MKARRNKKVVKNCYSKDFADFNKNTFLNINPITIDKNVNNDYLDLYTTINNSKYKSVKRYYNEINYNSGMTSHYGENRILREQELSRLLGYGKRISAFLVDDGAQGLQIQELLDNAIINIYSFYTHKKITLFAPTPNRIILLYGMVGEIAPETIVSKSEDNMKRGYNEIFCLK